MPTEPETPPLPLPTPSAEVPPQPPDPGEGPFVGARPGSIYSPAEAANERQREQSESGDERPGPAAP
jgi:hypothetical protein